MVTKAELGDKVDKAWRDWQSEESRDRGWDYQRCRALEMKYRVLKDRYDELTTDRP